MRQFRPSWLTIHPKEVQMIDIWWLFGFGFLGGVGMLFATLHWGHVIGHATHSPVLQLTVWGVGLLIVYALVTPVIAQQTSLTELETSVYLVFGSTGILFLLYEIGHWLHHHPRLAWGISTVGLVGLLALWHFRPPGAAIVPTPPPPPVARPVPGPGTPSGSSGTATASTGSGASGATASTGTASGIPPVDCAKLSFRSRQAHGCP
jgi:hypothetical protein